VRHAGCGNVARRVPRASGVGLCRLPRASVPLERLKAAQDGRDTATPGCVKKHRQECLCHQSAPLGRGVEKGSRDVTQIFPSTASVAFRGEAHNSCRTDTQHTSCLYASRIVLFTVERCYILRPREEATWREYRQAKLGRSPSGRVGAHGSFGASGGVHEKVPAAFFSRVPFSPTFFPCN
jgi:hypothetical protein